MIVKLVLTDIVDKMYGPSIYQTELGVRVSSGDFHSGSTFTADLEADEQELMTMLRDGARPVFTLVEAKP